MQNLQTVSNFWLVCLLRTIDGPIFLAQSVWNVVEIQFAFGWIAGDSERVGIVARLPWSLSGSVAASWSLSSVTGTAYSGVQFATANDFDLKCKIQ